MMMAMMAVAGWLAATAHASGAAIVLFAPNPIEIDRRVTTPGPMEASVAVIPDVPLGGQGTSMIDILFGSDSVPLSAFECGSGWTCSPLGPAFGPIWEPVDSPFGYYPYELFVHAKRTGSPATIFQGVLSFDLTGLADGFYSIEVDSARDDKLSGIISQGSSDPLRGSLPIRIVPEPATLALLAMGVVARRRHEHRPRTLAT